MTNGMPTGGIGAGELALLQNGNNGGQNSMVWPLVWLAFLGRNGGLFGGNDTAGAAAVTTQADAIRGVAESVSAGNLAACQNTNAIQSTLASNAAATAACCCDNRLEQANQGSLTRSSIDAGTFASQLGFKDLALQSCNNTNALQAQLAACCCETQKEILTQTAAIQATGCDLGNQIQMQTMTLAQEGNRNTQAILDRLNQQDINLLNDRIDEKNQEIDRLRLDNSQQAQNNALVAAMSAMGQNIINQITTICGCSCSGSQPAPNGG